MPNNAALAPLADLLRSLHTQRPRQILVPVRWIVKFLWTAHLGVNHGNP